MKREERWSCNALLLAAVFASGEYVTGVPTAGATVVWGLGGRHDAGPEPRSGASSPPLRDVSLGARSSEPTRAPVPQMECLGRPSEAKTIRAQLTFLSVDYLSSSASRVEESAHGGVGLR